MVRLLEDLGFRMVRFLEAPGYSYGWNLRGPLVFVWLDSRRPPGFRIFELLDAPRIWYGWTL